MIKNSFNDEVRATIEQNEHRHLSQRDYLNSSQEVSYKEGNGKVSDAAMTQYTMRSPKVGFPEITNII